ncbi:Peptidyl-prolyl cis-trans isomerase cyp6 [Globomyces sp. JEL0801]|nr:Peptidyl-prolyl cis-trans isomerase cyp6 [Globomyces sp. JEL0801]
MSVLIETTLGEIVIDLYTSNCQTGDPDSTGQGGQSIWGTIHGDQRKYFFPEIRKDLIHSKKGLVSFACHGSGKNLRAASQFFFTLADELDSLDGKHTVFGEVAEGLDILEAINQSICDEGGRPYRDIRIKHTIILDDPFDDPEGFIEPDRSPVPTEALLKAARIDPDEVLVEDIPEEERERLAQLDEIKARALTLEMVGDLPFAEIKPPENVLFVCKLNPITRDEDLEIIFGRFGTILRFFSFLIVSCEIIRDKTSGESLGYAFIEYENKQDCELAYSKMENVLIDDRRIHVDFSQSVSKLNNEFNGGKVSYGNGLEKKTRYRDQIEKEDDYELIFDHQGHSSRVDASKSKSREKEDDMKRRSEDSSDRRDRRSRSPQRGRSGDNRESRDGKDRSNSRWRDRSYSRDSRHTDYRKRNDDRYRDRRAR